MIRTEVYPGLFVGDHEAADEWPRTDHFPREGFSLLSAAKEPWHRQMVGYTSRGAPEGPERLFARRGNHMALNMVDAPDPAFFSADMIDAGLAFITERLSAGDKVLVHCNQGYSRSPSLALLWLHRRTAEWAGPLDTAMEAFGNVYPIYNPGAGIAGYLDQVW